MKKFILSGLTAMLLLGNLGMVHGEEATGALEAGLGIVSNGRIGPGKDDTDTQVYSFNVVVADAIFDEEGRIVDVQFDTLEVATPNYDGEGMPQLSGWPGQGGYNYDEDHDGTVDGTTEDTEDNFIAEVEGWQTKRDRGQSYMMPAGSWADQADAFAEAFKGMTIEEVEEWVAKYTSDNNGRPLKEGSEDEADAAKYDALTDDEKATLADVTSGATMSLTDGHGNLVAALKKAYENRSAVAEGQVASDGLAIVANPRIGPGKDSEDVQVYSFNVTVADAKLDADGKLVDLTVDVLEVASPNYDGEGMPQFIGFPGQSYNNDENHDGEVDGVLEASEDLFLADTEAWVTKRDRGEDYQMGLGSWASQMDAFEEAFIGMDIAEVAQWGSKYTSDNNGRPLKEGSSDEADAAKYDALTDEEKAALAEVTSGATMSISDPHGLILEAIVRAMENAQQ